MLRCCRLCPCLSYGEQAPRRVPRCCPTGSALLPSGEPSLWGDLGGKSHLCAGLLPRGPNAAGCVGRLPPCRCSSRQAKGCVEHGRRRWMRPLAALQTHQVVVTRHCTFCIHSSRLQGLVGFIFCFAFVFYSKTSNHQGTVSFLILKGLDFVFLKCLAPAKAQHPSSSRTSLPWGWDGGDGGTGEGDLSGSATSSVAPSQCPMKMSQCTFTFDLSPVDHVVLTSPSKSCLSRCGCL